MSSMNVCKVYIKIQAHGSTEWFLLPWEVEAQWWAKIQNCTRQKVERVKAGMLLSDSDEHPPFQHDKIPIKLKTEIFFNFTFKNKIWLVHFPREHVF